MRFENHNFDALDSTQNKIKEYTTTNSIFPLVVSKKMTAGRGQRGKKWGTAEGNLYFSFLLPDSFFIRESDLCFICGVAMAKAINLPNLKLKWANDIFVNDSKTGGILVEKHNQNLIAGIGINVVSAPNIDSPEYPISCLFNNNFKESAKSLLDKFTQTFLEIFKIYRQNRSEIFNLWKKQALWVGESVILKTDSSKISGIFNGIDENGGLILDKKTYFSGSMRKKS